MMKMAKRKKEDNEHALSGVILMVSSVRLTYQYKFFFSNVMQWLPV